MKKTIITVTLLALLIATVFTGCSKKAGDNTTTETETETESDGATLADASGETTTMDNIKETTTSSQQENTTESETTDSLKLDNETTQSTNLSETQHTHNWVAITKTVTITDSPATTRQELVSEAYDELVKTTKYIITGTEFNYDGYRPTTNADFRAHAIALNASGVDASYHSVDVEITKEKYDEYVAQGKTPESYIDEEHVHHDAVYKTVNVPAVTHTEEQIVGYKCSCGATK